MLKVGVIGLGRMGKLHFLNAMKIAGVQVVAVADKSESNLKVAKRLSVKTYDDYKDLINKEKLDAVVISLPNHLKRLGITYAVENNLDVFVDKPLARNIAESKDIVHEVEIQGTQLMVGVNYRHIDSVQKLKNDLDEGKIGDIVLSTSELIMDGPFSHGITPKPIPEWWLNKETAGGGALLDLGYHLIDIFGWMFGDVEPLYSTLEFRFGLPVEDNATIIVRSRKTSTKGIINVGWFSKMIFPNFNFRVNLHGTVGYECTDQFAPRNLYLHLLKEATFNFLRKMAGREIHHLSYTYYYASFYKVLKLFFEAVSKGYEVPVSLEDQVETVKAIEDAYKQHEVAVYA